MNNTIWLYWDNYPNKRTPPYIELCLQTIRAHCEVDFKIVVINSDNVRDYLPSVREDFFSMPQINNKSNYLRYKLLSEYGGVWLDSDIILLKNILPLLDLLGENTDLVATASPEYGYGEPECGFIISKPNGSVITKAIKIFESKMDANPPGHIFKWGTMGPSILRDAVTGHNYCHLDSKLIMPIGWQHARLFDRIDIAQKYLTTNTFAVMLYNEMFRRADSSIMTMSKNQLLTSKKLVSQIFRRALL